MTDLSGLTAAHATFGAHALIALGGGLAAVLSANLARALAGLIAAMFGIAGLYLLLNAPFIAFMHILIAVGAVSVFLFLAVMLTGAQDGDSEGAPGSRDKASAFAVGAACASGAAILAAIRAALTAAWRLAGESASAVSAPPVDVGAGAVGKALIGPYGLAFELVSVALFAAMIAAALLARQPLASRRRGQGEPS